MSEEMLDIVDENDEIIGQAPRSEIHATGLRHREVNVWFVTPKNEIIFQKRQSSNKEISKPLLDATVGGHVERGDSYLKTALKEIAEETGVILKEQDLILAQKIKVDETFPAVAKINNVFRALYIYKFDQDIETLKIEENSSGLGFLAIPFVDLINKAEWIEKDYYFNPFLIKEQMMKFYQETIDGLYFF